MALIKCPECGKEISSQAENCPNCEYPVHDARDQAQNLVVVLNEAKKIKSKKENEPDESNMQNVENYKKPHNIFRVMIVAALLLTVAVAIFVTSTSPESMARSGAKKILKADGYSTVYVDSVSITSKDDNSIVASITAQVIDNVSPNNVYYALHDGTSEVFGKSISFDNVSVMNSSREIVIKNGKPISTSKPKAEDSAADTPSAPSQTYNPPQTLENKTTAQLYAEYFVKQELKSPSTAKFPSYDEYTYNFDGKTWTVSGYVDAQNSFGATLRSNWTVTFTVSGADYENATLVSIDIE